MSSNPFLENEDETQVEVTQSDAVTPLESNPFLPETNPTNNIVELPPEDNTLEAADSVAHHSEPEIDPVDKSAVVQSLENIKEELEQTFKDANPDTVTEHTVEVTLDDNSKTLLDQDIQAAINLDPEPLESLEGIILCDTRNVKSIIDIIDDKINELK